MRSKWLKTRTHGRTCWMVSYLVAYSIRSSSSLKTMMTKMKMVRRKRRKRKKHSIEFGCCFMHSTAKDMIRERALAFSVQPFHLLLVELWIEIQIRIRIQIPTEIRVWRRVQRRRKKWGSKFPLILIESTFKGRRRGEPQKRSAGRDPERRIS